MEADSATAATEAPPAVPAVPAPQRKPLPRSVRVFPVIGAALALGVAGTLLSLYLARSPQFIPMLTTVVALYAVGKEGGIPLGIAAGGNPVLVGTSIFCTDLAMALLIYPLIHLAFDGAQHRKGVLGSLLRTARRHADKRRRIVDRYGAIGIYAFMLIPWAFNGPLVGIALGRIAELRPVRTMLVVGSAMVTTTVAWTVVVHYGYRAFHVSPWISAGISLAVGASVFAWGYLQSRKEKRLGLDAGLH